MVSQLSNWRRIAKNGYRKSSRSARATLRSAVSNSFREAVVDESQHISGLIAPPGLGEQACQFRRRPQFPGERGLRACDGERFVQARSWLIYGHAVPRESGILIRSNSDKSNSTPLFVARVMAPLIVKSASLNCPVLRKPSANAPMKPVIMILNR